MKLKNLTIALIASLGYEVLLKLSHLLIPSLLRISPIPVITSVLFFFVGIIILLFLYFFYQEESSNKRIRIVLQLLIALMFLSFVFRVPVVRTVIDYKVVRLSGEIIGFLNAILLFVLMIFYQRVIPPAKSLLRQAAVLLMVMFGLGIVKSLYSLISYSRFVYSDTITNFPPIFYNIVFIFFLIRQAAMINFLWRYYQAKFTALQSS